MSYLAPLEPNRPEFIRYISETLVERMVEGLSNYLASTGSLSRLDMPRVPSKVKAGTSVRLYLPNELQNPILSAVCRKTEDYQGIDVIETKAIFDLHVPDKETLKRVFSNKSNLVYQVCALEEHRPTFPTVKRNSTNKNK